MVPLFGLPLSRIRDPRGETGWVNHSTLARWCRHLFERTRLSKLKPIPHAEFIEQAEEIDLDCAFRNAHVRGNLFVTQSLTQQRDNLPLTGREGGLTALRMGVATRHKSNLHFAPGNAGQ